jgi:hypothetical protein
MTLKKKQQYDQNIVANLRAHLGDQLTPYSDAQILAAHTLWLTSDDYPDEDKVVDWISTEG